jgi:beta-lactamase regulating signal transducer with metallopeptidase domain
MTGPEGVLDDPTVAALGWALLHFLWQGLGMAAVLAVAQPLLRRRSAEARYLAACLALLLMAAAPGLTVLALYSSAEPPAAASPISSSPTGLLTVRHTSASPFPSVSALSPAAESTRPGLRPRMAEGYRHVTRAVEPYLPALVTTWLLGVLALSLRLLGGWIAVQRLPHRRTRPVPDWLTIRGTELARRLGVGRPVRLLESAAVSVPTVLGWLRAVVLVPAGALAGLPPSQLEALLAHELAHVRRHDYLVNLLQAVVETVLFYHPAVWWVSHRIRIEREHCCDDLAARALGDGLALARALTALESLAQRTPGAPPIALAGSGGDLLARIRRIVGRPGEPASLTPAWLGGTMVITLLLTTAALLRVSAAEPPVSMPEVKPASPIAVTTRPGSAPVAKPPRAASKRRPAPSRVPAATPSQTAPGALLSPGARPSTKPTRVRPAGPRVAAADPSMPLAAPDRPVTLAAAPRAGRPAGQARLVAAPRAAARPHGPIQVVAQSGAEKPASAAPPRLKGVVRGVSGPQIQDVPVLDLRGVPAREVEKIQSLKDVVVVLLDSKNRSALRASMEDVSATVVAGPDTKVTVEPFLEITRAMVEAMPARQKLLLVGIVLIRPDVPPALLAQKIDTLQMVGVVMASQSVRGALLGKMQMTGTTVSLPDDAGPLAHGMGENTLNAEALSRMADNTVYVSIGETRFAEDVTEELAARKIGMYINIGETSGPPPVIKLLKSRCPQDLGEFVEGKPMDEDKDDK